MTEGISAFRYTDANSPRFVFHSLSIEEKYKLPEISLDDTPLEEIYLGGLDSPFERFL